MSVFVDQPTDEQLAAEPQAEVAVSRSLQEAQGKLVDLQRRLLHVPLRPHVVPLPVVEREVGLHGEQRRTVAHIEGESDHRGSCRSGDGVSTAECEIRFSCCSLSSFSDAM